MAFGDLSGPAGLKKLNDHLKTKSYIEGFVKLVGFFGLFI